MLNLLKREVVLANLKSVDVHVFVLWFGADDESIQGEGIENVYPKRESLVFCPQVFKF